MPSASRRLVILLLLTSSALAAIFVLTFRSAQEGTRHPEYMKEYPLTGHAIASKLGNETAKAELGQAAWKLFHTTFARFPDEPTPDESRALRSYIYLFQRLYPCGECAEHFGKIINQYPPQVSSRSVAAAWGCHVHNEVNKSLAKPMFDCSKIGDFYDCGCADDGDEEGNVTSSGQLADNDVKRVPIRALNPPELEKEGWQPGG